MTTTVPESLSVLLCDLDFLSRIEPNTKPCYKDRVLVDAGSWVGAFYRLCRGESRKEVTEHIEKTIKATVEAINNTQYNEHMSLIINSLYSANKGITNLAHTYETDVETSKDIAGYLQEISVHLYRYQYLIKDSQKQEVRSVEIRNGDVRNAEVRNSDVVNVEIRNVEGKNPEKVEEPPISPVAESVEPKFKRPPKMKKAFEKKNL